MGQAGAGCREVRAEQVAEVVVGETGEQCRGDAEAAETGGDVQAGAARERLEGRGAVGGAGGGEVHHRVSGDDDGGLLCGFRSGTHAGSSGTEGGTAGAGPFGGAP